MVKWARLPSALSPNGDWDGSLTVLDGKPVILYDCYNIPDCLPPNKTAVGKRMPAAIAAPPFPPLGSNLGDPPHVGVARPVDPSDPNLTVWSKDPHNPISFPGRKTSQRRSAPHQLLTTAAL